ncbi:MAG TPA: VWA domain-containing protein [Methanothrix sp.]|nr:VWA domain-containing protein [Methanothrix sp.]
MSSSWTWAEVWAKSRKNWHWPLLPMPRLATEAQQTRESQDRQEGGFPFENYRITIDRETLALGPEFLEGLFDHLIVHYIFCPRSLDEAGRLALAAWRGLERPDALTARRMVNIFSDIVCDSFRRERSREDGKRAILGWQRLARQGPSLSMLDRVVLGFLRQYWGVELPQCSRPETAHLARVFSPGVTDRKLWPRQCRQMARILEPLQPGILGRGEVRCLEILNGNARAAPLSCAAELDARQYEQTLAVLGLEGDLARWYRDQSYSIEIAETASPRREGHPSAPEKWRLTDPCSELDISYSLSLAPRLIPGVTTYKRSREMGQLVPSGRAVPDLLVVLDSSRSMEGPAVGTKTHRATLAAFKACRYAHSKGAMISAINFSEKYLATPWTRDLAAVENVLVEFFCTRTHIPGKAVRALAEERPGCLILCITDTHIQNLYQEWEDIKKAAIAGRFVLFCIDQDYRDKNAEKALAGLGQVYYINRLEDLVSLVVDVTGKAYCGESFISSK